MDFSNADPDISFFPLDEIQNDLSTRILSSMITEHRLCPKKLLDKMALVLANSDLLCLCFDTNIRPALKTYLFMTSKFNNADFFSGLEILCNHCARIEEGFRFKHILYDSIILDAVEIGDFRLVKFLHQTHHANIHYVNRLGQNAFFFASSPLIVKYLHHYSVDEYKVANNRSTATLCLLSRVLKKVSTPNRLPFDQLLEDRTNLTDSKVSHCIVLLFSYGLYNMYKEESPRSDLQIQQYDQFKTVHAQLLQQARKISAKSHLYPQLVAIIEHISMHSTLPQWAIEVYLSDCK